LVHNDEGHVSDAHREDKRYETTDERVEDQDGPRVGIVYQLGSCHGKLNSKTTKDWKAHILSIIVDASGAG